MAATPLLKMPAAAERIGITPRQMRDLVTNRKIPFHKVGRFNMFDPDDLDQWIQDNRVEAL